MDKMAKRIGFMLSAFGIFVFVNNYFHNMAYECKDPYDLLILACTCLTFVSSFFNFSKYVQTFSFGLAALTAIFLSPYDGLAYTVLILIIILMYKYGMLNKKPITKFLLYMSLIIVTPIIGTIIIKQEEYMFWPIKPLVGFAFCLGIIILIFLDEIKIYVRNEKELKSEINNLNSTIEQTKGYIEQIEAKYIDPMKAGLTETELSLLKALCLYRESNTDLGKRLDKSPNTVKVQLSKIMNKTCLETRYDLISHCRYYFIKNS